MHGALPVVYLIDPVMFKSENCHTEILTEKPHCGQTVPTVSGAQSNCVNSTDPDMDAHRRVFTDTAPYV